MRAMVLRRAGQKLSLQNLKKPSPNKTEVLVRIHTCAVCRTDLHVVDGDLKQPKLPLVPGHEIIGTIEAIGEHVEGFTAGDRIGIPWLGYTCGSCSYCSKGQENLCDKAEFTGYTRNGGFAEYTIADHRYCFAIPNQYSDEQAAPLMCAGLIGYRSFRMTGEARNLGLYGFGAAAHIITQVAVHQGHNVFAFTKPEDIKGQEFAKSLGAVWVGSSNEHPPQKLDAAIIFAPVGALVPAALRTVDKAGLIVCAGIHMTDIPSFPYNLLWEERSIRSVANLTRQDGEEFLDVAPQIPIETSTHIYSLEQANQALEDLRHGRFEGAAVLKIYEPQVATSH